MGISKDGGLFCEVPRIQIILFRGIESYESPKFLLSRTWSLPVTWLAIRLLLLTTVFSADAYSVVAVLFAAAFLASRRSLGFRV